MSVSSRMEILNRVSNGGGEDSRWKSIYKVAFVAALLALSANLLDVILGFGETTVVEFGTKSAIEWFSLFEDDWFKGLYTLGILNIVYMTCMVPVYFAIFTVQRHTNWVYAALAMSIFFIGMAVYIANSAAIPMAVLASKYAVAGTDAERVVLAAAGEAALAIGEDFTPGSFLGLILQGIAAIAISAVMLHGGVFSKVTAWIGIVGFTFLSVFTIWATFVPVLYTIAYYFFGMIGGLLALAWFGLVSLRFLKLVRTKNQLG